MKQIMVLLILTLTACGKPHDKQVLIAPDFEPYVADFVAAAATQGKTIVIDDLKIEFADLGDFQTGENGDCVTGSNQTPTVRINSNPGAVDQWAGATENYRTELIFHELGHCLLNRQHDATQIGWFYDRYPESIMYPYLDINSSAMFAAHRDMYIQELFR